MKLKITQVRSLIGSQKKKHKVVMKSLGFRRNNSTLYKNDTPQIRGMLHRVRHLVAWEEIDEKDVPVTAAKSSGFTVLEAAAGAGETGEGAGAGETAGDLPGEGKPETPVEGTD